MMMKQFFCLSLCVSMMTMLVRPVLGQSRQDSLINFDWRFIQQPIEGAQQPTFDDQSWQLVQLPHDASIHGPFYENDKNSDQKNGFRPRLSGWYRKELNLKSLDEASLYYLMFEGVYRDAVVFINGQQVAHQLNGYEEFQAEVTPYLKRGKNVIAVKYDNSYKESSRWYNGEGIYRDVWLQKRSKSSVVKDGIYITTPNVTENETDVTVQTEFWNQSASAEFVLTSSILNKEGNVVATAKSIVPVAKDELYVFKQKLHLTNVKKWSVNDPYLYQVKTQITSNDAVVDEVITNFGVRTIEFDPDRGLLLNGEKVLVRGVNIHHDLGPLGAAAFARGFERRLEGLKRLGCNGIRLSHNPHDKVILDWCDKNGMLVFDEAFDKWGDQFFGEGNDFEKHWRASLEQFIRRDRNHPSVFIWSVGNETHQQKSGRYNYGIDQMKAMADFVHVLEPTRKVTCGLHPSRRSGAYRTDDYYREGPPEMEFYMDVVSTNYREEFWPVDHANYPQLNFILSEAQVGNLGNEWFNFNHDYGVGMFYWGGTDYIGESFGWPAKGWPNGIIDWDDHWKPFSYYIQSLFSEEPMVHVTAFDPDKETKKYWNEVNLRFLPMFSHWNWAEKDSVKLLTFSNADEVELFLNGKSQGVIQVPSEYKTKDIKAYTAEEYDPENPINTGPAMHKNLEWKIPYQAGEIKAVAKIDGKVVAEHSLVTAGEAYKIVLEPDRSEISADGMDLSYITVKVVDKNGVLVPDAAQKISFDVSGAGSNAGVGNGDLISDELFQASERSVFQGKALLIIRAGREAGTVTIKAKAKGLKSASIKIQTLSK